MKDRESVFEDEKLEIFKDQNPINNWIPKQNIPEQRVHNENHLF